jgi:hypothetical protein
MSWSRFPVEPGERLNEIDGPRAELLEAQVERYLAIRPVGTTAEMTALNAHPALQPSAETACNRKGLGMHQILEQFAPYQSGDWGNPLGSTSDDMPSGYIDHTEFDAGLEGSHAHRILELNPLWPDSSDEKFVHRPDYYRLRMLDRVYTDMDAGKPQGVRALWHRAGVDDPKNERVFRRVTIRLGQGWANRTESESKIPAGTVAERVPGERTYRRFDGSTWSKDPTASGATVIDYFPDFTLDSGGGYAHDVSFVVSSDSLNRLQALYRVMRWSLQDVSPDINDVAGFEQSSFAGRLQTSGLGDSRLHPSANSAGEATLATARANAASEHDASLPNASRFGSVIIYGLGKAAQAYMGLQDATDPQGVEDYDAWHVRLRTIGRQVYHRAMLQATADTKFFAYSRIPTGQGAGSDGPNDAANPYHNGEDEYFLYPLNEHPGADAEAWALVAELDNTLWLPDRNVFPPYDPTIDYVMMEGFDIRDIWAERRWDVPGGFTYLG